MKHIPIRTSMVKDVPGYWEFDFNYQGKRIRRKIKCTTYQCRLLSNFISDIINNGFSRNEAIMIIDDDSVLYHERDFLLQGYDALLDNPGHGNTLTPYEIRHEYLDQFFPISDEDLTICLLGRAGVGKSTIIQKLSSYWGSDLLFPFTDTSRTTTFSADYRFIPKSAGYKLVALLQPFEEIAFNIEECIDRAVMKYFELLIANVDEDTMYNEVLNSFVNDPNNTFDIRFSLGKFLPKSAPTFDKPKYANMRTFWDDIYGMIKSMCSYAYGTSAAARDDNYAFYAIVLADIIRQESKENPAYLTYLSLIETIKYKIDENEKAIHAMFESSPSFENFHFDDGHHVLSCIITDIDSDSTKELLRVLTSKKATQFGKSLLNRIEYLRVELPFNPNISLPKDNLSLVMRDTIGIAHNQTEGGGVEDSTHLSLNQVDAILIVDDARFNGDNNFTAILEHVMARVDPQKIFYAFNFYDQLTKADFDEDDDLDAQKIHYLVNVTKNAIQHSMSGSLFDPKKYDSLTKRLNKDESFFLYGLMEPNDYASINNLIKVISNYWLSKDGSIRFSRKYNDKPIVVYDYKKIPLIYQQAATDYYKMQDEIYEKNPPHFKTTEALTRRLSWNQTVFKGARTLTPVDDFYSCLIKALSTYLDKPQEINFFTTDDSQIDTAIDSIIGQIKTYMTEHLKNDINDRFLSESANKVWKELLSLTGVGCDRKRRSGILDEEHVIASDVTTYLNSSGANHIIDAIENDLIVAIEQTEKDYFK